MAAAVAMAPYELERKDASLLVSRASDPKAQRRTSPMTEPFPSRICEVTSASWAVGTVAGTGFAPSAASGESVVERAQVSS